MILRDILRFLTVTLVPLFRSVSLVYTIEIMSFFAVISLSRRPDNIIKSTNLNTLVKTKTRCFHCISGLLRLYLVKIVLVKTQPWVI